MTAEGALFAALRLQGPDAAAFLQGYLTADLDELTADSALPMAYCNLKGRVLASGWAAGSPTDVQLIVAASVADALAADLRKYLLFAKSKLTPANDGVAFKEGPDATEGEAPGSIALPPTSLCLLPNGTTSGHQALAAACVEREFVVVSDPISQRFLPQMIGLTAAGAVSFAKGCYLGQEVVARAEHRGEVKQKLKRFAAEAAQPPDGADVVVAERKVGTVVASTPGLVLASVRGDLNAATANGCQLQVLESASP